MKQISPAIINMPGHHLSRYIILLAILIHAFPAKASFPAETITRDARAIEVNLSEYGRRIHSLPADSLFRLGTGFLNRATEAPDSALICYITAQNRLDREHDRNMIAAIAKTFINTAYIYSHTYHDYGEAYMNLRKAEELCSENSLDSLMPIVLHSFATLRNCNYRIQNSGQTYRQDKNPMMKYFKKAFLTAQKAGLHDIMAYAVFNSLEACEGKKDTTAVVELAHRYLNSDIPDSNPSKNFITNLCHGVIHFSKGDYGKAIDYYSSMIPAGFPLKQDSLIMARGRDGLIAKAYEAMGMHHKSDEILTGILRQAVEQNHLEEQLIIYKRLYSLHRDLADREKAKEYQLAYFITKEKISRMGGNGTSINEIELKQTLRNYQKSLLLASVKERHDRILILCISIAALCAVAALILTIHYSRKRRNYIMELYKKNLSRETDTGKGRISAENPDPQAATTDGTPPQDIQKSDPSITSDLSQSNRADPELIEKIERIIREDRSVFDPDYQMARLCSQVGSNPTYVSRAINSHYGKSFKALLTERRVREACRYFDDPVSNSTLTIEAICLNVGFRSRTAFASAFKNVTGLTPSEYRQAARKYMPS